MRLQGNFRSRNQEIVQVTIAAKKFTPGSMWERLHLATQKVFGQRWVKCGQEGKKNVYVNISSVLKRVGSGRLVLSDSSIYSLKEQVIRKAVKDPVNFKAVVTGELFIWPKRNR